MVTGTKKGITSATNPTSFTNYSSVLLNVIRFWSFSSEFSLPQNLGKMRLIYFEKDRTAGLSDLLRYRLLPKKDVPTRGERWPSGETLNVHVVASSSIPGCVFSHVVFFQTS